MKQFEEAKIEAIHFDVENFIATSGVTCECYEGGEMPSIG